MCTRRNVTRPPCTIEASFEQITYTITASAGENGSIDPSGDVTVNCGVDQTFTITPNDCYKIADVLVDGESAMDDVTVDEETGVGTYVFTDLRSDHIIEATFEIVVHNITASAGDNGNIDPTGDVAVNCGTDQTFTITPDDCYQIADVQVESCR